MAKIEASHNRIFKNVFVCKDCGQKMRTDSLKVIARTVTCRRCGKHSFRAIKSKKK